MCNDGRLLTQRRREKIDIVTANSLGHIPTGHCMLPQQCNSLSAILDDCEAFLMIALNIGTDMRLFTYRIIENGGPPMRTIVSLYLLPLCHEK